MKAIGLPPKPAQKVTDRVRTHQDRKKKNKENISGQRQKLIAQMFASKVSIGIKVNATAGVYYLFSKYSTSTGLRVCIPSTRHRLMHRIK